MRCEYFEGCPVYQQRGEAACRRHFCNDDCPPEKERHGLVQGKKRGLSGKRDRRTEMQQSQMPGSGRGKRKQRGK